MNHHPNLAKWLLTSALLAGLSVPAWAQTAKGVQVVAQDLEHPWGLAFIDGGRMLVTERPGRLRVVEPTGQVSAPVQGLPEVDAGGQGGLLDVLADAAFATNRTVYVCYAEPAAVGAGNSTAVARARLSNDRTRLEQLQVIFSQQPKVSSRHHFGCRMVQSPAGDLYIALGDRFSRMQDAQTLNNHHGKVVRIRPDGTVPANNPFVNTPGAMPEIWSLGHRNPQGATWGPDGQLWVHEHGPQGGDEVNIVKAGRNYGWPVITYGQNYGGGRIGQGLTHREGMEQPLWHWTPSIAPSGMAWVTSDRYGSEWKGQLLVGALRGRQLVRMSWDGQRLQPVQTLLQDWGQRIRDVRQGPDGWIYLLTDDRRGQLVRLQP
jgi:aldose sugar dehydrogenase